jgi:hypothetical protein
MEKTLYQRVKRSAQALAVAGLVGLGGFKLGESILKNAEWERTRREVQMVLDVDTNRVITKEEWTPFYKFLGELQPRKTMDSGAVYRSEALRGYGLNLTTEQPKQYLNSQRGNTK